jgi:hypothetical protein
MNPLADWLMRRWLEARFGFSSRLREARLSLPFALILLLRPAGDRLLRGV